MPNQDLYDYLSENYSSVKLLDNGVYYAVDKNGVELFIPSNVDSSSELLACFPGRGGSRSDSEQLRKIMSGDNPPSYVAVLSPTLTDKYNILDRATTAMEDNNVSVSGVVVTTFSASGGTGFRSLETYLENHTELASSSSMIIVDGCNFNNEIFTSDMHMLKDNNVPIYHVGGGTGTDSKLLNAGFNSYLIGVNRYQGDHLKLYNDMFINGMPGYVLGKNDLTNFGSGRLVPDYILRKFNTETNKYDETTNLDSMILRSLFSNNTTPITENFKILEVEPASVSKYQDLRNLDALSVVNLSFIPNSKISSDLNYVTRVMSLIRSNIASSSFLSAKTLSFRSSTGIPGCISAYLNAYYDIMGQLMTSLAKETEAVISAGQAIADMDKDFETKTPEVKL